MQRRFILSIVVALVLFAGLTGRARAEIQVQLESPAEGMVVSGIRPISGWAFAVSDDPDNPVALPVTIRLFIDDEASGEIPCCVGREDVQAAYGESALKSGFGQVFNFGALKGIGEGEEKRAEEDQAKGKHTVRIEVSADGVASQSVEHTVTVVRPGGYAFLERPSLLGATSSEIQTETQEIMFQNVTFRNPTPKSNETKTGELWLAWQPNIQQLGVVGSRILSTDPGQGETSAGEDETAGGEDETPDEKITAILENPPGQTVSTQVTAGGIGTVSGWAFSENPDAEIDRVSLRVDKAAPLTIGDEIPCCAERPDVRDHFKDKFPEVPLHTGFGGLINFNLIPSGKRTIGVEIQDTSDPAETRIIDHAVTVVRLGDAEFLDEFKLTEESQAAVTGSLLTLQDVEIREKGQTETTTVDAGFLWNESCQCFLPWPVCGNGGRDVGEDCDGTAFGELSCETFGFSRGELSCNEFCEVNASACEGGSGAKVYVTLVNDDAVAVVSTTTNEVGPTIPVGDRPRGIAISPDGNEAYVANTGDNTVSVIATATKRVIATIPVGRKPQGIAFAPDGTAAYVTNIQDNTVSVIGTATRTQTTTIAVGRSPQSIAVTPDGQRAYVSNFGDDTVTVLDLMTNTPLPDPIVVGEGPLGVAVKADGTRVYVTNFGANDTDDGDENGNTVSLIDTATNTVIDTLIDMDMPPDPRAEGQQNLQVGVQPAGVAVIPATALDLVKREGPDAFVANFLEATVSVILDESAITDLSGKPNDTPLQTVGSFGVAFNPRFNAVNNEPYSIAITPNGLRGYVTLFGARKDEGEIVQVFSTLTRGVVATVKVGNKPFAIAIGPQ